MAIWKFFNNFTAGEWTPRLDGRADLQKYDAACRTLENMRVMPYGGVRFRPGTSFVAKAKLADFPCRLMPFQYSTSTRFMLEWGERYLRAWSRTGELLQEIISPYSAASIPQVQYRQINDVAYLVHPDYPVYKLSRVANQDWRLEEVDWTMPPMRDENVSKTTLALSAVSGQDVTMTASEAIFDPGHVGSHWQLRYLRDASSISLTMQWSGTSSAIEFSGNWSMVSTGYWYGSIYLERSEDNGTTWEAVRQWVGASNRNISASGKEPDRVLFRMRYIALGDPFADQAWTGEKPTSYAKPLLTLDIEEAYVSALVKVTEFSDATHVKVRTIEPALATTPTDIWSESAWSPYRGFPRAIGAYEQRLIYGGTRSQPSTIWGSVIDDFENFAYSSDDDAGIAYTFAASDQNPIQWIDSMRRIQASTTAREFSVETPNEEPLTPSNITVRSQSANGSEYLQAIVVGDSILYVQRQGRRLAEMAYSLEKDGFASVDLTLLAEHIIDPGITCMNFSRIPDPTLYCVRKDGQLAVFSYNREQDVTAWTRWRTDGAFESIASIYGSPNDEVWCVVRRTAGDGSVYRTIERFTTESDDRLTGCWLDCATIVEGDWPEFSGLGGLERFEGRRVTAVLDGRVRADVLVSGGRIEFDPPVPQVRRVIVGLPYRGIIQPMKLDVVLSSGSSQGRRRRISEITPRFFRTVGCKYGPDLEHLDEMAFRTTLDRMDASPPEFTGDARNIWNGGHDKSADLVLVQDSPLPFTLMGLAVKWEVFGE